MTTIDKLDKACEQSIRTTSWRWSASSHSESGKGSWNVGGVGGILCMRKSKRSYSPPKYPLSCHRMIGCDSFTELQARAPFQWREALYCCWVTIITIPEWPQFRLVNH